MSSRNNGGEPAYPCDPITNNQADSAQGLSKRELIAAMAMQGLCANPTSGNDIIKLGLPAMAHAAVMCADAILVELAK